jgi:hypothetical protein
VTQYQQPMMNNNDKEKKIIGHVDSKQKKEVRGQESALWYTKVGNSKLCSTITR